MSSKDAEIERLQTALDKMKADRRFWRQTAFELFDNGPSIDNLSEYLSKKQIDRLQKATETTKQATLFWVTESGERHKLAEETFTDKSDDEIRQYMIDNYWEGRLDTVSCSSDVLIEEVE